MDANEAMSKAMVEGQRFLEYGSNVARTRPLQVVPGPPTAWESQGDELASIEFLEAEVFLLQQRLRRVLNAPGREWPAAS